MQSSKMFLTSKTVIGLIVATIGVLVMANTGERMTDAEGAAWTDKLTDGWSTLVAMGGLAFALYGRVTAKDTLTLTPEPKRTGLARCWGAALLLPALLLLGSPGCSGDRAFVDAAAAYHQTVGEEWMEYVNADPTLSVTQKSSRIIAHTTFGEAIDARRNVIRPPGAWFGE